AGDRPFRNKANAPPAKLVYSLDEVLRRTKLSPSVLESWEQEFPFLCAGRTAKGEKIFRAKDVAMIRRIQELVATRGLTLAGVRRRVEEEFGLRTPPAVHPEKLRKVLTDVRDGLQEIAAGLKKRPS
ncbi:MAG: MerR family transcriptional regulator, partial [Candidatus Aminicenantes bacterium]|nr:MerR family transcriptional regulator [Candidatus Aminicenantes bacterium]